jgi:hypothetical protein
VTSRERVRAAIRHEPVDRVPLGFYAVDCDTAGRVLGRPTLVRDKIRVALALAEGRRDEVAECLKRDSVELYRKLDCADLIIPKEAQLLPPRDEEPEPLTALDDSHWRDRRGRVFQAVWDKNDLMCVEDPTRRRAVTERDFDDAAAAQPPDESVYEVLDHLVAALGAERYVASAFAVRPMPMPLDFEGSMMLYALEPELIRSAGRAHVRDAAILDASASRPGTAGAFAEQDMAGTNGPFVSPAAFRDLCLPVLVERAAAVKRFHDQLIYHNCGMNIPLMEMFISAGVDCYQSLQTTAGMEIGRLKERYGGRMAFWGGMPVETLVAGTPEETRACVRAALERGAPGGGFIFGPSHSIAFGTRYGNFMAMLEEFDRLRDR